MLHCEVGYVYFNMSYWCNADFDALLAEAGALTVIDREKSQELYIEAMNLAAEESSILAFYDKEFIYLVPNDVYNIYGRGYNLNYPSSVLFYELAKE